MTTDLESRLRISLEKHRRWQANCDKQSMQTPFEPIWRESSLTYFAIIQVLEGILNGSQETTPSIQGKCTKDSTMAEMVQSQKDSA